MLDRLVVYFNKSLGEWNSRTVKSEVKNVLPFGSQYSTGIITTAIATASRPPTRLPAAHALVDSAFFARN